MIFVCPTFGILSTIYDKTLAIFSANGLPCSIWTLECIAYMEQFPPHSAVSAPLVQHGPIIFRVRCYCTLFTTNVA